MYGGGGDGSGGGSYGSSSSLYGSSGGGVDKKGSAGAVGSANTAYNESWAELILK